MPFRSTGCITCRKRKVRCDETRPGCERCRIHGVICPGYTVEKPGGIEFQDQTNLTVRRANNQYRAKARDVSYTSSSSSSGSPHTSSPRGDVFTPQALSNHSSVNIRDDGTLINGQALLSTNGRKKGPTIQSLTSPSAERARFYNEFLATYLPRTQAGSQNGHFSFYQTLAFNRSDQPALQQGLDALSLVQVGSVHSDPRLRNEAVRQYGKALNSLARSIIKGDSLYDDDALAAVTVLATCELFEDIAIAGEGWGKHVHGANGLIAARGPDSIRSDLALIMYSNHRHGALLYALISRKEPFMAAPEWRKVAFRVPLARADASLEFYDIALQIPGLLQRHDELDMMSATAVHDIDHLVADSAKLEADLRAWYSDWQSNNANNACQSHPIDDFPTFTSLCSDRTFEYGLMYPDFLVGYLYSLCWMVMHSLRTNTQSLFKRRHALLPDWYPDPEDIVPEEELLQYVLNLCQTIPFFVEPICSSTGHIAIFLPLRTAALYFTEHGHWKWLRWIGAVKNSVFVKGLSPPNVKR